MSVETARLTETKTEKEMVVKVLMEWDRSTERIENRKKQTKGKEKRREKQRKGKEK